MTIKYVTIKTNIGYATIEHKAYERMCESNDRSWATLWMWDNNTFWRRLWSLIR